MQHYHHYHPYFPVIFHFLLLQYFGLPLLIHSVNSTAAAKAAPSTPTINSHKVEAFFGYDAISPPNQKPEDADGIGLIFPSNPFYSSFHHPHHDHVKQAPGRGARVKRQGYYTPNWEWFAEWHYAPNYASLCYVFDASALVELKASTQFCMRLEFLQGKISPGETESSEKIIEKAEGSEKEAPSPEEDGLQLLNASNHSASEDLLFDVITGKLFRTSQNDSDDSKNREGEAAWNSSNVEEEEDEGKNHFNLTIEEEEWGSDNEGNLGGGANTSSQLAVENADLKVTYAFASKLGQCGGEGGRVPLFKGSLGSAPFIRDGSVVQDLCTGYELAWTSAETCLRITHVRYTFGHRRLGNATVHVCVTILFQGHLLFGLLPYYLEVPVPLCFHFGVDGGRYGCRVRAGVIDCGPGGRGNKQQHFEPGYYTGWHLDLSGIFGGGGETTTTTSTTTSTTEKPQPTPASDCVK